MGFEVVLILASVLMALVWTFSGYRQQDRNLAMLHHGRSLQWFMIALGLLLFNRLMVEIEVVKLLMIGGG